jgi:hypothetical protein
MEASLATQTVDSQELAYLSATLRETLWRPKPQSERVTPEVTPQDKHLQTGDLSVSADAFGIPTPQVAPQVATQVATQVAKTLEATAEAITREALQDSVEMKDREHFRKTYLEPLVTAGWLERTIPDKPTSRLQKYRLTSKGRAWLNAWKGGTQ